MVGKRNNSWLPAFSPFPKMFSKGFFYFSGLLKSGLCGIRVKYSMDFQICVLFLKATFSMAVIKYTSGSYKNLFDKNPKIKQSSKRSAFLFMYKTSCLQVYHTGIVHLTEPKYSLQKSVMLEQLVMLTMATIWQL